MAIGFDSFGARLRAMRVQAGLSQVELARAVGRHQTAIGPYERDEYSPPHEIVKRIAQVLSTTPEFLLFGREPHQAAIVMPGELGRGGVLQEPGERNSRQWLQLSEANIEAYLVGDDCMAPAYRKGQYVLVAAAQQENLMLEIGSDCLIELSDGRRLLRRLAIGRSNGFFNLCAYDGTILPDMECAACQPVLGHLEQAALTPAKRNKSKENL